MALVEGGEELAAEQCLASADFASDLDETLAILDGYQQRVKCLLVRVAGVGEARIRRDPERHLAQPEVIAVHGHDRLRPLIAPAAGAAAAAPSPGCGRASRLRPAASRGRCGRWSA